MAGEMAKSPSGMDLAWFEKIALTMMDAAGQ